MNPGLMHITIRFLRLIIMPVILLMSISCATITSNDLIPVSASVSHSNQRFEGSVQVQFAVIMTLPSWSRHSFINAFMLKEAVEKALTKTSLFSRVEQQKADYVLDIWMDKQSVGIPMLSLGEYTAGVLSIWRLTRASDGKVLVCDFVDGRGAINERGFAPSKRSMIAAIQNMIQNGLATISDRSAVHLSALSAAGNRSSIGPWITHVRQNWAKLRAGMTLADVEDVIGPVRSGGAVLDYVATKTRDIPLTHTLEALRYEGLIPGKINISLTETENGILVTKTPKLTIVRKEVDLITTRLVAPVVVASVEADGFHVTDGVYPTTSFDTIAWDSLDIRKSNEGVVSQDYQCRSALYTLEFQEGKLARWKLH